MLKLTEGFRSYLKNIVSKVQNTLHLEVRIDAGAPHTVIYTDFQFLPRETNRFELLAKLVF